VKYLKTYKTNETPDLISFKDYNVSVSTSNSYAFGYSKYGLNDKEIDGKL